MKQVQINVMMQSFVQALEHSEMSFVKLYMTKWHDENQQQNMTFFNLKLNIMKKLQLKCAPFLFHDICQGILHMCNFCRLSCM